MVKKGWATSS